MYFSKSQLSKLEVFSTFIHAHKLPNGNTIFLGFPNLRSKAWGRKIGGPPFLGNSYEARYTPLKCENEYPVLALREETAVQAVVVSQAQKAKVSEDERPRLRAS